MATMGQGLLRYTVKTGEVKQYVMASDAGNSRRVNSICNNYISQLALSPDEKRIYAATTMGVSRVHLHRKMKELTGQTPHDFIRNIRLKQAAHLLASKNMNITEVMYACGFNNAASFSTIFKKFYGVSPRDYMNEQRK